MNSVKGPGSKSFNCAHTDVQPGQHSSMSAHTYSQYLRNFDLDFNKVMTSELLLRLMNNSRLLDEGVPTEVLHTLS